MIHMSLERQTRGLSNHMTLDYQNYFQIEPTKTKYSKLVWRSLDSILGLIHPLTQGDDRDEDAKLAYTALMRIQLYEPETETFRDFQRRYKLRQKEDYNYTFPVGVDVSNI